MHLQAILTEKPPGFVSVWPNAKISDVVAILAQRHIGAVLVTEGTRLAGVLSERDIVRVLAERGPAILDMIAADLMTSAITTGTPDMTVEQAMELMTQGRFRHLPILENGALTGLVSIGDVVKAMIEQSRHEVETLKTYVGGRV